MQSRRQDWIWILALLAAVVAIDAPSLLGYIVRTEDSWLAFVPGYAVGEHGWPPRWNPYVLGGTPHIANPQFSPWYPPRWAFAFAGALDAFGPFCFAHFVIAAVAMFLCLRVFGCGPAAAGIGALSFACGSHIQGRLSNPGLLISGVWLPLVAACAARAFTRPGLRWTALLAAAMALVVFAGSPLYLFYAALLVAATAAWELFIGGLGGEPVAPFSQRVRRVAGRFAIAALLAFGLSAVQLLPTAEFVRLSYRADLPASELARDPLAWSWLDNLFLGSPDRPDEYLDKSTYFGLSMLPFLLLAVLAPERRRREGFFVLLALVSLWIALGTQAGAFQVLHSLPVLRTLSGPARALILFAFSTAALAGFGVEHFARRSDWSRHARLRIVLLASALLAAFLFAWKAGGLRQSGAFRAIALDAMTPLDPALFLSINAAVFIALGVLLIAATQWLRLPRRVFPWIAAAVLFIDLFHFSRRLPLPMSQPADLAMPATAAVIREDIRGAQTQEINPPYPFRVVGYEPTRLHPGDVNSATLRRFLMPNLAALYGLSDIQGFDPLICGDTVRLVEATAGRSPIDDPVRMLNIAKPAPALLLLLNVRYVVGDVRERLVARPSSADPVQTLVLDKPTTLVGLSLVTLLNNAQMLPEGAPAAMITVGGEGGASLRAPLLAGVHTADYRAADPRFPCAHRPTRLNMVWSMHTPYGRVRVGNSYGQVFFERPIAARLIDIRPVARDVILWTGTVAAIVPEPEGWRRILEEGRAPVYRNEHAPGVAWMVHRRREAASKADALALVSKGNVDFTKEAVVEVGQVGNMSKVVQVGNLSKLSSPRDLVSTCSVLRYEPDRIEVALEASAPGLLCFSELFYPGWRATIDGRSAGVLRVNYAFRAVAIETPGRHTIALRFAPRSLAIGKVVSLLSLALVLALFRRSKFVVPPSS
jgi:hypothetical protein